MGGVEVGRNAQVKKIMHVLCRAPYGTIYTYEGLEMIMIMAAYGQDLSLVFIGDGVYALKKGQDTSGIGIRGFSRTFMALVDYDVEKLYVDKYSLEERGLSKDDLIVEVAVMNSDKIGKLMKEQDVIIHH